jgi:hypothetical protein
MLKRRWNGKRGNGERKKGMTRIEVVAGQTHAEVLLLHFSLFPAFFPSFLWTCEQALPHER